VKIAYSIGVEHPHDHEARITLQLEGAGPGPVDLVFPSWVPGSYAIKPYPRNVLGLRALDPGSGAELPVERIDKGRARVGPSPSGTVRVEYSVYGHALITEGLDVTSEHLFLNAGLCLPYVDGQKDGPHDLVLHVPPDWKILTELREVERAPPTYRAATYDELVDAPVDCGNPTVLPIHPMGIPHRIVLCGSGGNYEAHRVQTDLTKIVEATAKLFGELPPERYTFFYHLGDRRDGGLEHRSSASMVIARTSFRPETDYQAFLRLTSHEYVHRFIVKRIRPKVLGPFDYTRENYTRLLWAMEGTTDYYAPLLLRRAGLTSAPKYLERIAKDVREYREIPGRLVTSLEEASLLSWIDLHQRYENTVNQSVSYYLKGALVSLCLDLEIRHRTENRSSLDEAFRTLWREYGSKEVGLEEGELETVLERSSGLDLSEAFRRYVRGTDEVDFSAFLAYAGLTLAPDERPADPAEDAPAGYLGVEFENSNGFARIRSVRHGSPGRLAGLSPGDEVVAMDASRVPFDQFANALKRYPAGSEVELTLFRRGLLTRVTATTGTAPPEKLLIRPLDDAPELAKRIYASWLDAPWPPAKPTTPSADPS
jgi:predicted metalloprotease with PDZ domain